MPALFNANHGILGGAERYSFELARHMAKVVPTTLVSFGPEEIREQAGELNFRVIGSPWYVRGMRTNPMATALLGELKKSDVVHCHQRHILASSVAAISCRLTNRRVFVSDLGGGGWDLSAYIPTDRWFHGHLHISEYSRTVSGHAAKPWAHVILGGIDTEKFSPDPSVQRDGSVLFVGRLLPHKGIADLIQAIPPDRRLDIVGQGYNPAFLSELKTLAHGKDVLFHHGYDDRELIRAYRRAQCVVLPSVYKTACGQETRIPELLGQTLLEGMACGAPAICTNVASMPEVVEDGVTGLIVPPNDPAALGRAIRWLTEHPVEAKAMGEAARNRVLERFTWPQVVRRCLEIYALA